MATSWLIVAALLAGVFAGRWLDQRWGTAPWMMLSGLGLGLGIGMYELARLIWRRGGPQ